MLVHIGSWCLEYISGFAHLFSLTKASCDNNLLLLKGFTCELTQVGHTALCNSNTVSYEQTHETYAHFLYDE